MATNVVSPNVGYNAVDGNYQPIYGGNYYPPGVVKSTSATATGTWLPASSVPPGGSSEAAANGVTATPATAWTTGQFAQGRDPGTGGQMFWNGTTWMTGKA